MGLHILFLFSFMCLYIVSVVGASVCKPFSFFKVDCNICICGANGREYSCETNICPHVPNLNNFITEFDKDGRVILKPKTKDVVKYDPEDDLTYYKKTGRDVRGSRIGSKKFEGATK